MYSRATRALIVALVALFMYDVGAYFYFSFEDYLILAAIPTFVVLFTAYFIFRIILRRTVRDVRTFEVFISGESREAISRMEMEVERESAESMESPDKMPELLKKLIALYLYYRKNDQTRASRYASLIRGVVGSGKYPENEEARRLKELAEALLGSEGAR
jgi:hypothetical protein